MNTAVHIIAFCGLAALIHWLYSMHTQRKMLRLLLSHSYSNHPPAQCMVRPYAFFCKMLNALRVPLFYSTARRCKFPRAFKTLPVHELFAQMRTLQCTEAHLHRSSTQHPSCTLRLTSALPPAKLTDEAAEKAREAKLSALLGFPVVLHYRGAQKKSNLPTKLQKQKAVEEGG